jgi:hypothetical protein
MRAGTGAAGARGRRKHEDDYFFKKCKACGKKGVPLGPWATDSVGEAASRAATRKRTAVVAKRISPRCVRRGTLMRGTTTAHRRRSPARGPQQRRSAAAEDNTEENAASHVSHRARYAVRVSRPPPPRWSGLLGHLTPVLQSKSTHLACTGEINTVVKLY